MRPSRPGPAVPRGLGAGPGPGGRHCRLPGTQAAGPALLGRVPDSGPLGRSRIDYPFQLEGVLSRAVSGEFPAAWTCRVGPTRATRAAARQPPGPVTPVRLRAQGHRPSGPPDRLRFGGFDPCRADSGPQGPGPGLVSSRLPAPAAAAALLRKPPTQADCSPFEVRISPTGWPKRPQGPRPQAGHCWWLCPWDPVGGKRPTTLELERWALSVWPLWRSRHC